MNRLAVFDIDGTIAGKDGVPQSVIDGLDHLHSQGFLTTVSTGRGYKRAKEVLGEAFEHVVSPDALMIVEHGTKIVDFNGNTVIADHFQKNELEHIVDFIRANIDMIDHVRFWSDDLQKLLQVWCPSQENREGVQSLLQLKGYTPEVFSASYEELLERLIAASPSNVTGKLKDYVVVHNLKLRFTRSDTDTIFQDGLMEFVRNISDKGRSVQYLERYHGVAVKDMLIAGNAINDVDMLNLEAGTRVLVGSDEEAQTVLGYITASETVVRVHSPEELGQYLQSLS